MAISDLKFQSSDFTGKDIASLSALLESSRNFFTVLSKAKAAKIGLLLWVVIPV